MSGIHAILTKPVEVQVATWDPSDPGQCELVLGWLTSYFDQRWLWFEKGLVYGGLHLHTVDKSLYVAPGDAIVLDPATGQIDTFDPDTLAASFDYVRSIYDPNQPALFDFLISVDTVGDASVLWQMPRD